MNLSIPRLLKRLLYLLVFFIVPFATRAQVTAGFTVDYASGCVPLIVHFTNTSTGATSYTWDLGNGSMPTIASPLGTYVTAGTYMVTLTAYDATSSSSTTAMITVYPLPVPNFFTLDTLVCKDVPVTFTNTSSGAGPLTYNWNFGDGLTDASTDPTHAWDHTGYYNVTLHVTDALGCMNSYTRNNYVHVLSLPTSNFSASPTYLCQPSTVNFTDSSLGAGPLSYAWSFGDGGTSTLSAPSHFYGTMATWNSVELVVTDVHGCKDTMIRPGYVQLSDLVADFTSVTDTCLHIPLTFLNTSTSHFVSSWDFGDGFSSTAETGTHTYNTPGTYNLRLAVYNGTCWDTLIRPITIHPDPVASFSVTPANPCPSTTLFTYNATMPPGATAAWSFSGIHGTGNPATHSYSKAIFTDTLWVTDANGCITTLQRRDTIAFFPPMDRSGCAPLTVEFGSDLVTTGIALDLTIGAIPPPEVTFPYPYGITSYLWNFGDGSPTSTLPNVTHVYDTGSFMATLTITTSNGCTKTLSYPIVSSDTPVTHITSAPAHVCFGQSVTLSGTSSPASVFSWNYGDGTGEAGLGPKIHEFASLGTFLVTFMGINDDCPRWDSVTITVDSPMAAMHLDNNCGAPNTVTFQNISLGANSYTWLFGDGATSTVSPVSHTYPAATTYNARLATYNAASGCRDTLLSIINLNPLSATVMASRTYICAGAPDTLTASIIGTYSAFRWLIDGIPVDSTTNPAAGPFYRAFTPGVHTLKLALRNIRGCWDTFTHPTLIRASNPVAAFTISPPTGCTNAPFIFTDASTNAITIPIAAHEWNFYDGSGIISVTSPAISHSFSGVSGIRPVRETIIDSIGCISTSIGALSIYQPVIDFNASATTGCIGTPIHFTNFSLDVVSSFWMFGDGTTSTALHPTHAYGASGAYTVRLAITDIHGCTDTLTRPSYININPAPVASFTMSDTFAVCPPLNVNFTNTTTGALSYYWSFGNGSGSYAANPSNPYSVPGAYTVTLIATNSVGCTDTVSGRVSVFGYSGAFSYSPISGCSPLPVHFNVSVGGTANITWDFSDGFGVTSTTDTITHTYTAPGSYLPKLILTDLSGCTAFSYGADTIKVNNITPWFSISANPVCANTTVSFTDSSYSTFPSSTSRSWTFGDGGTSTLANPVHAFTTAGTYTVTLTVTNTSGCSRTVARTVTINPQPSATGSLAVCIGTNSTLTGSPFGGVWSGGAAGIATISSSGVMTGIASGTARVTYTSLSGCIATAVATVYPVPGAITGDSVMCQTNSVTLSSSPMGGNWSWTAGISVAIGISTPTCLVTGVSPGTATVTYTLGSGCFVTKQVTVNATAGAISGPASVCVAASATYSTSTTGGTWVSGNLSVATINPSSGFLMASTAGTTVITYQVATGCSAMRTVTVTPLPSPITGGPSLCQGITATLASVTTGGTWSSGAPGIASIGSATGVLTGVSAGTVIITYTVGSGCFNTRQFTVNAAVGSISGPTSVCNRSPATFSTSASGGFWLSGDTSIAHIDSFTGVLAPTSAGVATITYKLTTGCSSTYTLTVMPLPAAITGDSAVCQGTSITLASLTAGGTWSSSAPGIAFVGMTTGLLSGISAGTATITYTRSNGCFVTLQVTTNGAVSPISGPASLCNGTSGSFSTATSGGFWLSGDPAVAHIDSFSGVLAPVATGTVIITYQLSTGCSAMRTVTVIPAPGIINGALGVCHYLTTTLSDTAAGGTWASLAPTIASIGTTGIVTGHWPGTATIAYVMPNGCSVTAIVTVNPLPPAIGGPTNVCVGSTVTLTNTAPGGTWSSGTTSNVMINLLSGAMTGVSAGTGLITYTLSTGCITTTIVTVLAVPPPITGPSTVCGGHAINLTNSLAGGVWTSPGAPGIATFNPTTVVVVGITPGTILVSYTIFTGCAATSVITVNPLPPPIGGTASVCVNSITTLTNFVASGTWTSSNGSTALIDTATGIVTGVNMGLTDITYTINTGCYNIRQVTVHPLPAAITGTALICEGSWTVLSSATPGGTWGSFSPTVATAAPLGMGIGMVNGLSVGTAIISYKLPFTGCFTTIDVTVNATPPPITGSGHVCIGSTSLLTDSIPGGMWTSSNPAIAFVNPSGLVSGLALGTAIITYVLPGSGCTVAKMVTVQPLPNVYSVTGGGSYCAGDTGVHVGLNGSEIGVSYALYYGSSATGYLTGTNLPLDFGLMTLGGVYTVQATNATTGCVRNMSGSATVVETPPSVPLVSIHTAPGDTVCPGGMATVSPIAVYGGSLPTYVWEVNGMPVSTATTYSFIPADGDLVKVTMTSSASCITSPTASAEKVLHVAPSMMPLVSMTVDPGDTVCQYTLVTYMANPSYGGSAPTYTWMVNSALTGAGPVFSYVPDSGDMIECHMHSNYVCRLADSAVSGTVTMVVDSIILPHIVVTPHPGYAVDSGTTVTFTTIVTDAGAAPTYQWYINGVPVMGATNDSFATSSLHHYDSVTCRVTSSGVCHDISAFDWAFISVSPVGVQQINTAADVRLVPNPNNGAFTIKGTWGTGDEEIFVEVTNMLGQAIYRGQLTAHNGKVNEQMQLDRALANGMYMLNMRTAHDNKVFHFVVEQ